MTIITLTRQDTPSRPITLNTDFIAAVNPLRKVVPDGNSQVPMTKTIYAGTEVILSSGTKYNVLEAYPDVVERLNSASAPSYSQEAMPETEPAKPLYPATPIPPRGTVLAASGVPQMANTVTQQVAPEPLEAEIVQEAVAPTLDTSIPTDGSTTELTPIPEQFQAPGDPEDPEPKIWSPGKQIQGDDDVITKYGDERSAPEPKPEMTMAEKLAARPKPAKKVPAKGVKPVGAPAQSSVRVDESPTEHAPDLTDE